MLEHVLLLGHQSQKKNVYHPGFVFLAELALQSDGYVETCDTYRKKHSCRCHVLLELHKTISVPQRLFDVKDATKQSRNLKHTKYHHLDLIRSLTKWESMCSRSLTQLACASQMGTTYDQAWIVRESESVGSLTHACLRAFVHGWTRWTGWPELVRCDRRTHNRGVLGSTLAKNGAAIRPAGLEGAGTNHESRTTRCHAQEDDVESHQRHAHLRQRIDGHDSQRMFQRRQRDDPAWRFRSSTVGTSTSSTQSCHHG